MSLGSVRIVSSAEEKGSSILNTLRQDVGGNFKRASWADFEFDFCKSVD